MKLAVMGEVKTHFRPEFVNRIDEIVVFHALDEKHIAAIAKIQLQGPREARGGDGDAARGLAMRRWRSSPRRDSIRCMARGR